MCGGENASLHCSEAGHPSTSLNSETRFVFFCCCWNATDGDAKEREGRSLTLHQIPNPQRHLLFFDIWSLNPSERRLVSVTISVTGGLESLSQRSQTRILFYHTDSAF